MQLRPCWRILTLVLSLLVVPCGPEAQPPRKLVGLLSLANLPSEAQWHQSPFRHKLEELGWHEGDNIAFAHRAADGETERLPDLAAALVRLRPDVIVTGWTPGVRALQQATTTIPIVSVGVAQLVEQGLVASLAHPGGNITGVENSSDGIWGKRFELLKDALPQIAHVALLCDPTNPAFTQSLPRLETEAHALGVHLELVAVRHLDAFDAALATILDLHPDALAISDDGLFYAHLRQIFDFATTHRLPTLGTRKQMAEAGSLMTYGNDNAEVLQRAAVYVDKILRGTRPGDLPIERLTQLELILNLKTATALGLTFSPMFLFRADAVLK